MSGCSVPIERRTPHALERKRVTARESGVLVNDLQTKLSKTHTRAMGANYWGGEVSTVSSESSGGGNRFPCTYLQKLNKKSRPSFRPVSSRPFSPYSTPRE